MNKLLPTVKDAMMYCKSKMGMGGASMAMIPRSGKGGSYKKGGSTTCKSCRK